jgi:hypothetical protein
MGAWPGYQVWYLEKDLILTFLTFLTLLGMSNRGRTVSSAAISTR